MSLKIKISSEPVRVVRGGISFLFSTFSFLFPPRLRENLFYRKSSHKGTKEELDIKVFHFFLSSFFSFLLRVLRASARTTSLGISSHKDTINLYKQLNDGLRKPLPRIRNVRGKFLIFPPCYSVVDILPLHALCELFCSTRKK